MLKQRILTAIVLIPLALGAIFLLPLPGFALVIMAVLGIAAWEWSPIMGFARAPARAAYAGVNAAVIGVLWWLLPGGEVWTETGLAWPLLAAVMAGAAWWLLAVILVCGFPGSRAIWSASRSIVAIIGLLTLVPAWAGIVALRAIDIPAYPLAGPATVLFILVLVWAADIGAYFTGKSIGRHKMMPDVSPNKTIEGLSGGLVLAFIVMILVAEFSPVPRAEYVGFYTMGFFAVLASVFGDLSESMFKRCAGVKDSGAILPGHGGILDRVDSLTAALPVAALIYHGLLF